MSSIHSEILTAVEAAPGIGPGQVADVIGQDKSYVRRVMKGMAAKGAIRAGGNGNGYAFFPAALHHAHSESRNESAAFHSKAGPAIPRKSEPIEGSFLEISPARHTTSNASASRALVSVEQPFDSRTETALRQHEAARKRGALGSPRGQAMGQEVIATWNAGFLEPEGVPRSLDEAQRAAREAEVVRLRKAAEWEAAKREEAERAAARSMFQDTGFALLRLLSSTPTREEQALRAEANGAQSYTHRRSRKVIIDRHEGDRVTASGVGLLTGEGDGERLSVKRLDPIGPRFRPRPALTELLQTKRAPEPEPTRPWWERLFGAPGKAMWK
jgi:hypothetical protein